MRLPDFLGLGAQRAGTTWLDALLRGHPALWLPERRKELHYFDRHHERGAAWYAAFFARAPADRLAGEITPRYLYEPDAPARAAALVPGARLIAILREPVARAYSQYALTVRDEDYAGTFRRFLAERPDALARGRYHEQLVRWTARFPRERLCVLVLEQVVREPARARAALAALLGVDPALFPAAPDEGARNAGGRVRRARGYAAAVRVGTWLRERDWDAPVQLAKRLGVARLFGPRAPLPPLEPELRAELAPRFAPEIERLEADFGLDLSLWRGAGS